MKPYGYGRQRPRRAYPGRPKPGSIYVLDRGYVDFARLKRLMSSDTHFHAVWASSFAHPAPLSWVRSVHIEERSYRLRELDGLLQADTATPKRPQGRGSISKPHSRAKIRWRSTVVGEA